MNFIIRKAKTTDAKKICDVHVASIQTLCAADYTLEQITAWCSNKIPERYQKAIADSNETIFVAEVQNKTLDPNIVGWSSCRNNEVHAVYVAPGFSRQGIGTALLQELENELRSRGVLIAQLSATITAQTFYLAHGWELTEGPNSVVTAGVEIPCISMSKNLQRSDSV